MSRRDDLNKIMEKLRARLYTLAEASLPSSQADSFKRATKDYTSETWDKLVDLIKNGEDENNQ